MNREWIDSGHLEGTGWTDEGDRESKYGAKRVTNAHIRRGPKAEGAQVEGAKRGWTVHRGRKVHRGWNV